MRKFALLAMALLSCVESSLLFAQKRVEVGIFVDYLSISQTNTNNFGVGGRFGCRIHRNLMMEGELAYGYGINFEEAYRDVANGNITAIKRTSGWSHSRPVRANAPACKGRVPSLRYSERRIY